LRHHTWNKPKCLVSVRGQPILYHLFGKFPASKFWIIGDYLFDQLALYLQINPPGVDFKLIQTRGSGTASGIVSALTEMNPHDPVVLVWSDLIVGDIPPWPNTHLPVVCTTDAFTCRWTVSETGRLQETVGSKRGVAGLFYLPSASLLQQAPDEGEFVKWWANNISDYKTLDCADLEELGDFATIEQSNERIGFSRFFNNVDMREETVVKTVLDPEYQPMHRHEVDWYRQAQQLGFRRIPKVLQEEPLTLERIFGQHAYQMHDLNQRERKAVMADYLDSLIALHDLGEQPPNAAETQKVYIDKTKSRVQSIAAIIPGFESPTMTINGKKCRNIFAPDHSGLLEQALPYIRPRKFVPIHGDPTFSNTIIDDKLRVWFIDPRGYFAEPGIFGDPAYDFAKVFYSAIGGYDAFNRRKFKLYIDNETVEILMEESIFKGTARSIFADYLGSDLAKIETLHGLIWLSLTGYARDDVDSIIGAFYLGLYWLESGFERL
jgi:hypothetical protein